MDTSTFERAPWGTALGTGVGYALILLGMFALLFLVPFVAFSAL